MTFTTIKKEGPKNGTKNCVAKSFAARMMLKKKKGKSVEIIILNDQKFKEFTEERSASRKKKKSELFLDVE